jgi:hypothetical protein
MPRGRWTHLQMRRGEGKMAFERTSHKPQHPIPTYGHVPDLRGFARQYLRSQGVLRVSSLPPLRRLYPCVVELSTSLSPF